jgi:hypothetical protein
MVLTMEIKGADIRVFVDGEGNAPGLLSWNG